MSAGRLPCTRNGRPSCARGRREILLAGEAVRSRGMFFTQGAAARFVLCCRAGFRRAYGFFRTLLPFSCVCPGPGRGVFSPPGGFFHLVRAFGKCAPFSSFSRALRAGLRVFTKRENLSTRRFLPCSAMSGAGFFRFFPAPAGKDFRMPASRISGMIFRSGGLTVKHGRERP